MKLLCLLRHKWRETHRSYRALYMSQFHPMAGSRFECDRCGKVWDDLPYGVMKDSDGRVVNGPEELSAFVKGE